MDYFTKNKLVFWIVIVLIVLNVLLLSTVWIGHAKRPPRGGPGRGALGGMRIMEDVLGLNREQVEAFEQIRKQHFERTRLLNERRLAVRIDLVNELFVAEPDREKINRLLSELKGVQGEFDQKLFQHFGELRDQCTDEQKSELKSMLIGLLETTTRREWGPQEGPPKDRPSGPGPPLGHGPPHGPEGHPPPR